MDEILPNLGLELPDVGSDQDTWGDILNENLRILDNAVTYDAITKTLGAVDVTLTTAEAAHGVINLNGTLTANVNLIVPVSPVRLYLVNNGTTGAFTVTVKTPLGTGVVVNQGANTLVYSNGTNIVQGATSVNGSFAAGTANVGTLNVSGNATVTGALSSGATTFITTGNKIAVFGTGSVFSANPASLGALDNVAIGATTPSTGAFTNLSYSGTLTGGTGVINIGSGQIYKDAAGLVGIGNATPGRQLSVGSAGAVTTIQVTNSATGVGGGDGGIFQMVNSDLIVSNQEAGNLLLSAAGAERARITSGGYFKASNTGSYQFSGLSLHEFDNDQNTNVLATYSGSTGINVIGVGSNLPAGALGKHFVGSIIGTGDVFQVLANGNVQNTNNSYGAISDAKHKENIVDASSYLDRFMQVRFRNFNFIGSDLKQFGVIAQELEQVFPGLVDESPDMEQVTKTRTVEVPAIEEVLDEEGNVVTFAQPATTREEEYTESVPTGTVTKSVKYSILAQIQGKVIQEQQAIINAQQAQIDSILARLTALEAK